jgi:site-specific DNA-adenine methylase
MTSYHGGKQRIGKEIAQIIYDVSSRMEEQIGTNFKGYVEPFCGMLGVYQHIPGLFNEHTPRLKYQAGDINASVIKMWKALQKGWNPPTKCSEKRFYQLKGNGQSSAEKGFIGHACGYRSTYFSTFFDRVDLKKVSKNILKMTQKIKNIKFSTGSYDDKYSQLSGYIIYCDPPYFKGSKYLDESGKIRKFDYDAFYTWIEKMAQHNLVFISERAKLPYQLLGLFNNEEKIYLINNIN